MSARCPLPPFPTGWYVVAPSTELRPGDLRAVTLLGREAVALRTRSGDVRVTDAHCPHLGAHFGHGGTVEGETLRCPFHDFRFDGAGACVSTPYGFEPPAAARLGCWPVRERNGFVLAWFDAAGGPPSFEVPEIGDAEGWSPLWQRPYTIATHPQETTENSVDLGHLMVVHGYTDLEILRPLRTQGPYLNVRYAMKRRADVFGMAGRRIRAEFEIHVHGLGWSFVEVDVPELGVRTRHYVLPTPIDGERTTVRLALAIRRLEAPAKASPFLALLPNVLATRLVGAATWRGFTHDFEQDLPIWAHKRYVHPPALARGDGPVGRYRAWARQFYPGLGRDDDRAEFSPTADAVA